jgi:DNA-binding response OmpR family regulator
VKILIADDDTVSRKMLLALLRNSGHEVTEASDGVEAFNTLLEVRHDLAILDWMMPGMTGTDICKALRERNSEPYIYIILLTALSGKNDMVTGLESGADDFLVKPFHQPELEMRLRCR